MSISDDLRQAVLQAAIQGKLTKQLLEDGNAKDLLEQIKDEKAKLVKEGKLKKEKPLPDITEDEKLFDIPENWEWVRLGSATYNHGQKKPDKKFCYIDVGSIDNKKCCLGTDDNILEPKDASSRARKIVELDDVIYATIRPYLHNISIIDRSFPYEPIASTAFAVMACCNGLYAKYLYYSLLSPMFDEYANDSSVSKGVAYPAIAERDFFNGIIPLPPLAEQKRIVAKVEEIMAKIDELEKTEKEIDSLKKAFPADMKASLLQAAMQGKLTEQLPEDGRAKDLLEQIKAEKAKLIKEGKLKKEKPLPDIAEDEKPFDIPDNWEWCRLGNIVSVLGDGIHGTPVFDENGSYYFVNGNNLVRGKIVIKEETKRVSKEEYEKYKKPLNKNTILVSINGTIGNFAFYNDEPIMLGKSACYFSLLCDVEKIYICHILNTKLFTDYAVKEATQTTIKNVSLKAMRLLPFPIPPLDEQKRIIEKLDKLLPLCDGLK